MFERGYYKREDISIGSLLGKEDELFSIPRRNRMYHHQVVDQKQLLQDLWSTIGAEQNGEQSMHYLNQALILSDKTLGSTMRHLVYDAGSRFVGLTMAMSADYQVLSTAGHVRLANLAQTYLENGDGRARLVLQDPADQCYQRWVTKCDTADLLVALQNRQSYNMVERLLLANLQESLNFFTIKLASHPSLRNLPATCRAFRHNSRTPAVD